MMGRRDWKEWKVRKKWRGRRDRKELRGRMDMERNGGVGKNEGVEKEGVGLMEE